jgi:hypothetical protein
MEDFLEPDTVDYDLDYCLSGPPWVPVPEGQKGRHKGQKVFKSRAVL